MLITNAAIYSQTPVTGWLRVDPVDAGGGCVRLRKDGHNLSVRADGNIEPNDNEGANETFAVRGDKLVADIGEGPRVIVKVDE